MLPIEGAGIKFIRKDGNDVTEQPVRYVVSVFLQNGELFDYVEAVGGFREDVSRFFFEQLMSAVNFIH